LYAEFFEKKIGLIGSYIIDALLPVLIPETLPLIEDIPFQPSVGRALGA
jgi:hypothetical protein